jgi:hypothetical protein
MSGLNGVGKNKKPIYHMLKSLGEDKLAQIDAMLFKGVHLEKIANHIHKIWGLFDDIDTTKLVLVLSRYKNKELTGRWLMQVTDDDGNLIPDHMKPIRSKKQKVDAHELLQDLVLVQQERLNKVYEREKKLPTTMETVRRDIDTYGKLLIQLANLQMDLGFIERAPLKIQQEMRKLDDSILVEAERVVTEIDNRSQQAIALTRVLEVLAAP